MLEIFKNINWTTVIVAFLGGLAAWLAFMIAPASERLAFRRKDRDQIIAQLQKLEVKVTKLEEKVERLEDDNKNLLTAVAVLIQHDESLRDRILVLDPNAKIATCEEILKRFGVNLRRILGQDETKKPEAKVGNQT